MSLARPASRHQSGQILALLVVIAATLAVPLGWRGLAAIASAPAEALPESYLPALEARRERIPFDPGHIEGLQDMQPGYVIIGDSMGGRIDPARLTQLSDEFVAPILRNATGSAYWYLAFKNYVVAADIHPKWVFVFFRDTNLTDPLWRGTGFYREVLDYAATDREPELNAVMAARTSGPWYRVGQWIDATYGADQARGRVESGLTGWLARVTVGRVGREAFVRDMNAAFDLDKLRPIPEADLAAAEDRDADFAANVNTSVLPLFMDLARERGLRLCFVRVLRRTLDGRPRPVSEALATYVRDLRAWVEARGGLVLDDREDPRMWTIRYDDGDHIARGDRVRYTELFWERMQRLSEAGR